MKPIQFCCYAELAQSPQQIADQILVVENWRNFRGFAFLPGIEDAEFERRTPEVIGSRIRVRNQDGSSHVEEIVEWQPGRRVKLRMNEFSAPLNRLAREFEELWEFEVSGGSTCVRRSFQLHAKSWWAWPLLVVIALFLKRAIARHLHEMR